MSRFASDAVARRLNLEGYQRHIFLCMGPKCCEAEKAAAVWEYLKRRLDELGLANTPEAPVFRTRAACLRVCCDGPIAVVYPEGTWYRLVSEEVCEEIIQSHLLKGIPVEQYCFARNPLVAKDKRQG